VTTTYYRGFVQLGVVTSVKKDGVETVKSVFEYEPGSIDVKPGDTRPVPPPSSSAVGKKPHTIDPKADGSPGRASGNHPEAPAEVAKTVAQPEPWTHEPTVIERLQPPLNLAGNTSHQFHRTMSDARAAFRAAARNGTHP